MKMTLTAVEYQVRPVTRYIVTRHHSHKCDGGGGGAGSETKGEFDNERTAQEVGYALCKDEHQRLGWPLDDPRIQYPKALPVSSEASHAANEREVRAAVGEGA